MLDGSSHKTIDMSNGDLNELSLQLFSGSLFGEQCAYVIKNFSIKKEHTTYICQVVDGLENVIVWDSCGAIKKDKNSFQVKAKSFISELKKNGFDFIDNYAKLKKDFSSFEFIKSYCPAKIDESAMSMLIDYGNGSKSYCMQELDKMSSILSSITVDDVKTFAMPLKPSVELYELSNAMDEYDAVKSISIMNKLILAGYHEFVLLEVMHKKFKWRMLALDFYSNKKPIGANLFDFGKRKDFDDKFYRSWGVASKESMELNKQDAIPMQFMANAIESSFRMNLCNRVKSKRDLQKLTDFLYKSYARSCSIYRLVRKNYNNSYDFLVTLIYEYCSAKDVANSF